MKLDSECIRDILFAIEEMSTSSSVLVSSNLLKNTFTSKYDAEVLRYHIKQLDMSNCLVMPTKAYMLDGDYLINDLSPIGHKLLSDIRQDTNWNKVKSIAKATGTTALQSILTISENVASTAIAKACGLQ